MSENIQPSSKDNQIVEDLAKKDLPKDLSDLKNKDLSTNLEQNLEWYFYYSIHNILFRPKYKIKYCNKRNYLY